ncbi:MAG: response regulator [Candidatus Omnitrophota bacterium]
MAKIMVVDDEIGIRELLRNILGLKGHKVVTIPSVKQALASIFQEPFDLVILDMDIAGESGMSVLKKIRESNKSLPVVIYSGTITSDLEKEARSSGATEVLHKDVGIEQLVGQIDKILKAEKRAASGQARARDKSVLIVDDEAGIRDMLRSFFRAKGYKTFEAASGEDAVRIAGIEKFSVVLLDINMTGMDGLETLKELLKMNPKLGIVMATSETNDEKVKKAVEIGAYGYVLKPFDFLYLELVVIAKLSIADNG